MPATDKQKADLIRLALKYEVMRRLKVDALEAENFIEMFLVLSTYHTTGKVEGVPDKWNPQKTIAQNFTKTGK